MQDVHTQQEKQNIEKVKHIDLKKNIYMHAVLLKKHKLSTKLTRSLIVLLMNFFTQKH